MCLGKKERFKVEKGQERIKAKSTGIRVLYNFYTNFYA
jgi:hypothetical protein